jgi:hypothetical protein
LASPLRPFLAKAEETMTRRFLLILLLVAAPWAARAVERPTQTNFDPQADKMLRQMSDQMAKMKAFKVRSTTTEQSVKNGQRIDTTTTSLLTVKRPSGVRSDQLGTAESFFYDGKTFTITCSPAGPYATAPAPPQIDAAIDRLRDRYQIDAVAGDLFVSNAYRALTDDATSSKYLGVEYIAGVKTHHLAFTGTDGDFQIWITEGPQPLPVQYTVVPKKVGASQYTVRFDNWDPEAVVLDSTFKFQAPAAAVCGDQFPISCVPPAS